MGISWMTSKVTGEVGGSSKNESQYGTRTPIMSPEYTAAFNAYKGSLNPSGANANQQTAIDWTRQNLAGGPVRGATSQANADITTSRNQYGDLNTNVYGPMSTAAPRQLGAAPQATAAMSAGTSTIDPRTAGAMAGQYKELYGKELIDPALAAYDYGTDRAFSALDARTAGAGAFGNSRSGLGYSDLGTQSALGRGTLKAGLLSEGLNSAFGLGAGDANRFLSADTTNAANLLGNNQFNAAAQTQNSQFNTGLLDSRDKFNVNAGYQGDQQKLQAADGIARNIAAATGISQQILDNIVTANGIDIQAAQDLFTAGTITQSQLESILEAAQAGNGFQFTQNTDTTGKNWKVGTEVGFD